MPATFERAFGPAFHPARSFAAMVAWVLVPYLAWVTFAAVLNFSLWRLNA